MPTYSSVFGGAMAAPGINAAIGNVENTFYWNNHYSNMFDQGNFDSTTADSGNTVSTVLRPGLLLGKVYSTGKLKQWDPAATDGTQYIFGILDNPGLAMTDSLGTARGRWRGGIMVRGAVKLDRLLIAGNASFGVTGNANEYIIRAQLQAAGFLILDDPVSASMLASGVFMGGYRHIVAKTADYTVKAYESGTLFTTRGAVGAVNFTLPTAVTAGLWYGFYNIANQNLTVTAGTVDTMVAINDATARSVSFQSANLKIGGMFEVFSDGTGWLTRVSAGQTSDGTTSGQLVTVAT